MHKQVLDYLNLESECPEGRRVRLRCASNLQDWVTETVNQAHFRLDVVLLLVETWGWLTSSAMAEVPEIALDPSLNSIVSTLGIQSLRYSSGCRAGSLSKN